MTHGMLSCIRVANLEKHQVNEPKGIRGSPSSSDSIVCEKDVGFHSKT